MAADRSSTDEAPEATGASPNAASREGGRSADADPGRASGGEAAQVIDPGPDRPTGDEAGKAPTFIVGIGASAGGLAAISRLLEELPADTGAAFVVVQHLDPDHESMMPAILSSRTEMPVRQAEDGARVGANQVWTLPPRASMELCEGAVLRLEKRSTERSSTVVDRFLRSLAVERGETAIGVLLSGGGSDGTLGLKAVREHGGLTIVQDPDTAEFDGMPRNALRAGWADHVLTIGEMAAEIERAVRRGPGGGHGGALGPAGKLTEGQLTRIAAVLRSHTGHDFGAYKEGTLVRRLGRRLLRHGGEELESYIERLRQDGDEAQALFQDLLISVTEFFRDPEAWQALADQAVPAILGTGDAGDPLRAWIPGCASGEEAYGLAILLAEHASRNDIHREITIFGTDVDERALGLAREGLYTEGIAEHVSAERLERFFKRENDHYRVASSIREMCIFAPHDLLTDPPFSHMDLVCCRNLLIYLERAGQERVLAALQYALRAGGYLFLGPSEHLVAHSELFEAVVEEHRIFRRTEVAHPVPMRTLEAPSPDRVRPGGTAAGRALPADRKRDAKSIVEQVLLRRYGPACVVINQQREALHFVGRTGKYLEPSGAASHAGLNVLDMAEPGLRAVLRSALREAERSGAEVVRRGVPIELDGHTELVDIVVRPANELGSGAGLWMIVFREVARSAGAAGPGRAAAEQEPEVVRDLERELRETRAHLDATIEDLEGSNEELRSSNEELLSMNEELQTAKEEAQSISEELKTVNDELKQKIADLDAAHSDLQNLFRSTQIATIFLDRDLVIERFTPTATDIFRLREADTGRPIGEIVSRFADWDVLADCREVLRTLAPKQREVRISGSGAWYTARIFPYRTIADVIEGVVLTFTDVTQLMRAEKRLREERLFAESIVETVRQPLVVVDHDLKLLSANRAFHAIFDVSPDEAEGARLYELERVRWDEPGPWQVLARVADRDEPLLDYHLGVELPGRGHRTMLVNACGLVVEREEEGALEEGGARILVALEDVTERRKREKARREEAEHKDWFLAMLGHELRNPLAPLRNCLTLLQTTELEEGRRNELLEIMARQVTQLTRMVEELMDLGRIGSGKLDLQKERVELAELVSKVITDHRSELEGAGLSVELELPDAPVFLHGDAARLRQVLGNLMMNARKYTESGGRVRVALRGEPDRQMACISVADTGAGISAESLEHVFDAFHQGTQRPAHREAGLGIGLTLAKMLTEAHGGSIWAESEGPGQGTKVTVRLPVPADAAGQPEQGRQSAPTASPRRVLLVEDEAETAKTTAMLLEADGHEVTTVPDGESALVELRDIRPHIVLCDLSLSGPMTGYDLAREVRADAELRRTRLVAVTASGRRRDRELAREVGFDGFVVKPVSQDELRRILAASPEDE